MEFWQVLGVNVASSLVVAFVTATCVFFFQKKYFSKLNFSKKLQSIGFSEAVNSYISQYEWKKFFKNNDKIQIMYVSGLNLMKRIKPFIEEALARGAQIRFLCADPDGVFTKDIETMELSGGFRQEGEKVADEIREVLNLYRGSGLQVRFYSTQYRMPLVIGENEQKKTSQLFLTITLPPYKSKDNIILRGYQTKNDSEVNFPEMMRMHFETVWELSRDAFPNKSEGNDIP